MLSFNTAVAHPAPASRQQAGSVRGVVYDKDFDVPLAGAEVQVVETRQTVSTTDQGNYVFTDVPPGKYTLVFAKDGYVRQVRADVVVAAGQLTDVDVWLAGEFTELDELVVQDILQVGAGSEAALLKLRLETPAMMDSIGADLMSRAGVGDAASALKLVAGASVADGKTAVIRGLPDRYVSSQMNGVRLPSADEDKRAVELDQFPSAVIESIQVTKTFTPDQQGDASGGAVDVRLKGIPDESIFQVKTQVSYNTQVTGESEFLTYDGGGVNFLGNDGGERDIQYENIGQSWDGAVGVSTDDAPIDYKMALTAGKNRVLDNGWKIGGLASIFYERDSSFFDDGIDDSYWVTTPGAPMTPETIQGTPTDGDFKTALYDVTQGSQSVQWGSLGTFGVETDKHALSFTALYTQTTEDTATLAEDTRGKAYFFPGYDPNDPTGTGNDPSQLNAAPYLRLETLEYTERQTGTFQLNGRHELPIDGFEIGSSFKFRPPELDWTAAYSFSHLDQPDKRQFGALWQPASFNPGFPPDVPPFTTDPTWYPYKPAANFNLGNLQRIWKDIKEDDNQFALNVTFPFEQWDGHEGYAKTGLFDDSVDRTFEQETFSNFGDSGATYQGDFDDPWSAHFPFEDHPITESLADVDYRGDQDIFAWYGMIDMPLTSKLSLIGGARFESTKISTVNDPESQALWFPDGSTQPVSLMPGDADVSFEQDDLLPSIGIVYEPVEVVTVRASYSETVARQTFKELTPILQQEYLGGPVFIGNPDLGMSSVQNYDLRVDYRPYQGSLFSASWFDKQIDDPIEYVQVVRPYTYTTAVNYPEGQLTGFELEARQHLGEFTSKLEGLSLGANATFINSEVTLSDDEIAGFEQPNIDVPMTTRDMTNAPEHLYNIYLTYDFGKSTQAALFYTVQGDTLVAGAGEAAGNFVPSVYAKQYDTLNLSLSHIFGKGIKVELQAKNLTNPRIEEVYRSDAIGDDVTKTSYTKGIEYSLGISINF